MSAKEPRSSKDKMIGRQLGHYELTELVAAGGMARIYKAMDVKLQRPVAVKLLQHDAADSDNTLATRFRREAQAIASLEHPNIIPIYHYDEIDDLYFIAMKLVEGSDLARELAALKRRNQKMDIKRALGILEQVASALDHAHSKGVVHRDVKPSNILLDKDDYAVLTDFGLVLRASDVTMGTAFGTPRYIAPEQAIASEKAVPQSDVYSLAVVMYEIAAGQTPFTGDTPMEIALSHISDSPPPPSTFNPNIPREVERELLRALEKDPLKRHATASEFILAIKRAYAYAAGEAPPPPYSTQPVRDTSASGQPTPAVPLAKVPSGASPTPIGAPTPKLENVKASKSAIPKTASPAASSAPAPAAPAKPETPRRSLLPVLLALVVVAIGAFVIFGRDLFSGGQNPVATDQPGSATEAAGEAAVEPTDEPPSVTLSYDYDVLVMINDTAVTLNVHSLVMGSDDNSFSGDRGNVSRDILPVNQCLRIRIENRNTTTDDECVDSLGIPYDQQIPTTAQPFWRSGDGVNDFGVTVEGTEITRCPTVARGQTQQCTFIWPASALVTGS
ncbi:MAG: serine/threonine protein kinase [Chloroflexi bacterium]|nr:serine/threonine protein kinase [Chloroflexota bacterium]